MSRLISFLALVTASALLAGGCASTTVSDSPDKIVKQRSEQRWQNIFDREYGKAYEYYSPGYRSKFSEVDLEIALRVQKVRWISADYVDQTCEEKSCVVRYNLGYRVASPVPGVAVWTGWETIEEQWVMVKGEWWYLPPQQ